jgi:YD repeat-containing protein
MGNILTTTTAQGTYNYTYDALYRLTDVEVDMPEVDDEAFTYDKVGNRKTEAGINGEWNYNENNELLTFANVEYMYDDNGNMTQKKVGSVAINYIYDAADRLVRVKDDLTGTGIAEYDYDPFGRRLWKEVGGTRTYFFYSDEGLVAEYDSSGNEIKTYGYKPDSTWTTDPLFLKQNSEYYFYQNDLLGTSQKLVGSMAQCCGPRRIVFLGKRKFRLKP